MILELILKICQLKLICEIENGFSMALTIYIKAKFWIHLTCLNLVFNKYSKAYDNFIFMGDFNAATSDNAMEDFCSLNDYESLISNQHITKIMRIQHMPI